MNEKEYLSVAEIGMLNKMTTRNVRRIIGDLIKEKNELLIHKDNSNKWKVHQLLKNEFKRKRARKERYFALSFDAYRNYTVDDLHQIMEFVRDKINDPNLEINYTVERKKANGQPHVHSFIKVTNSKAEILKYLKLIFTGMSFHEQKVYDLERWKQYITKDGSPIINLKK
ncbi:hypothetical protein [Yeosuana marina]|uniref:hypothetical protein n=1 Tax=Yeosuana marina TaxID=1565536 RepID=UPI0030C81DA7